MLACGCSGLLPRPAAPAQQTPARRLPVPELAKRGSQQLPSSSTANGKAREAGGTGDKVGNGPAAHHDHVCSTHCALCNTHGSSGNRKWLHAPKTWVTASALETKKKVGAGDRGFTPGQTAFFLSATFSLFLL
jgi:hypothetical protein